MTALMSPFGMCAELLNTKVVQPLLGHGMEIAVKYAQNLNDEDLKDKVGKKSKKMWWPISCFSLHNV